MDCHFLRTKRSLFQTTWEWTADGCSGIFNGNSKPCNYYSGLLSPTLSFAKLTKGHLIFHHQNTKCPRKVEIVAKWKPVKKHRPKIVGNLHAELCSLHIASSLWVLKLSQMTGECDSFSQQKGPLPSSLGPGPLLHLLLLPVKALHFTRRWNCYDVENAYLLN